MRTVQREDTIVCGKSSSLLDSRGNGPKASEEPEGTLAVTGGVYFSA